MAGKVQEIELPVRDAHTVHRVDRSSLSVRELLPPSLGRARDLARRRPQRRVEIRRLIARQRSEEQSAEGREHDGEGAGVPDREASTQLAQRTSRRGGGALDSSNLATLGGVTVRTGSPRPERCG